MNLVFNGTQYNNVTIPMLKVIPNDINYATGVGYSYTLQYLRPGTYTYYFTCSDGEYINTTRVKTLNVIMQSVHAPYFKNIGIVPNGTLGPANFTFTATYVDIDNNAPASFAVMINGTSYPICRKSTRT